MACLAERVIGLKMGVASSAACIADDDTGGWPNFLKADNKESV